MSKEKATIQESEKEKQWEYLDEISGFEQLAKKKM